MKQLLIVADAPGWAFDHRARALQTYAPDDWGVQIEYNGLREISEIPFESADVVFLLDPKKAKSVRQYFTAAGVCVPLVSTHNSGPGRPGYSLDETHNAADYIVVNNYAAWAAGRFGHRDYRACNISNGVDLKTFGADIPWAERPNRALWIGSVAKADDEDDVKGARQILSPLSRILPPRLGIETDFRSVDPGNALAPAEMREWYNGGRYLICASKTEGTPNICLEAAACGVALITTNVGNMPELVVNGRNGKIVYRRDTIGFMDAIEFTPAAAFAGYAEKMLETIRGWDWSARAPWYFALFEKLSAGITPQPFSYVNTPPAAVGV